MKTGEKKESIGIIGSRKESYFICFTECLNSVSLVGEVHE